MHNLACKCFNDTQVIEGTLWFISKCCLLVSLAGRLCISSEEQNKLLKATVSGGSSQTEEAKIKGGNADTVFLRAIKCFRS